MGKGGGSGSVMGGDGGGGRPLGFKLVWRVHGSSGGVSIVLFSIAGTFFWSRKGIEMGRWVSRAWEVYRR